MTTTSSTDPSARHARVDSSAIPIEPPTPSLASSLGTRHDGTARRAATLRREQPARAADPASLSRMLNGHPTLGNAVVTNGGQLVENECDSPDSIFVTSLQRPHLQTRSRECAFRKSTPVTNRNGRLRHPDATMPHSGSAKISMRSVATTIRSTSPERRTLLTNEKRATSTDHHAPSSPQPNATHEMASPEPNRKREDVLIHSSLAAALTIPTPIAGALTEQTQGPVNSPAPAQVETLAPGSSVQPPAVPSLPRGTIMTNAITPMMDTNATTRTPAGSANSATSPTESPEDEEMQEEWTQPIPSQPAERSTRSSTAVREDESQLDHIHSEEVWQNFEARFRTTNMMVVFSISDPTVFVPASGYLSVQDMAGPIIKVLGARGVSFGTAGLMVIGGASPSLVGRPVTQDRNLWITLRRGYIKIRGATVWMQPAFTGKRITNLSIVELEYTNANHVSVGDLHTVLQRWGATEALIVSHGKGRVRRSKWPSIECIQNAVRNPTTDEIAFTFRLFFECEETACRVYAASLVADRDHIADIQHAASIHLRPTINVLWDPLRLRLYRPTDAAEQARLANRLYIFGVTAELTERQIEQRLTQLGYTGARVALQAGRRSGTVELRNPDDAERLMTAYGRDRYERLYVGNVRLSFNTPAADGGMRCFSCNQGGHFSKDCHSREVSSQTHLIRHAGRANSYWQGISAANRQVNDNVAPGYTIPPLPGSHALASRDIASRSETTMRQLIISQVREHSQAALASFQADFDRHKQATDERLQAQELVIQQIQQHHATDTEKMSRVERMLVSLTSHLLPADFQSGDRSSDAIPRR